jgi:hypothetical protein
MTERAAHAPLHRAPLSTPGPGRVLWNEGDKIDALARIRESGNDSA